jgi:MOSC domain-containing protein YiiM
MRLVSVNVSQPKNVKGTARGTVSTAIDKQPVTGPVMVRTLNVDGDRQGDPTVHGGADMAVYAYAADDYVHWRDVLGWEMPRYGWFGENFTIEGADSGAVFLGDVLQVGDAVLQVTQPRSPCFKLDHQMGDPFFSSTFARSGRVGFYLRVLREGLVEAGAPVETAERDANGVSIRALSDLTHYGKGTRDDAERILRLAGLAGKWHVPARKLLARLAVEP